MKSVLNFVREQDIFAIPVQLTYKGDKEFKTAIGGFFSILFYLTVAIYTAVVLKGQIDEHSYKLIYR